LGSRALRQDHQVGQEVVARGGGEADGDLAGVAAGDAARGQGRALGQAQDAAGLQQEGAAGGGQPHRAAGAVQQGHAEDALQQLDLPAQRRLGHVQPLGRAPEVELLGRGHEAAQLAEFEHRKAPARDPMEAKLGACSAGSVAVFPGLGPIAAPTGHVAHRSGA
jgi:hypothetical protein